MGKPRRILPADFASVAATLTNDALSKRFRAGVDVIQRWRRETGVEYDRQAKPKEPAPADFAIRASAMSLKEAQRSFKRSFDTISRWYKECGIATREPFTRDRPMPSDFRMIARSKSIEALMKHYSAGRDIVRRWISETGEIRKPGKPAKPKVLARPKPEAFVRSAPDRKRPAQLTRSAATNSIIRYNRDVSHAGQAADYLKRFGGVWRCNPTGGPNPKGSHWRRGSAILTDAELIERAERLGWDADAWRRVA